MESLLDAVMAARGGDLLWHQVMDMPANEENYAESSCSAMFIYGCAGAQSWGFAAKKRSRRRGRAWTRFGRRTS